MQDEKPFFRFRAITNGTHTEIVVFVADGPGQTGANAGRVVLRNEEAEAFMSRLNPNWKEHCNG